MITIGLLMIDRGFELKIFFQESGPSPVCQTAFTCRCLPMTHSTPLIYHLIFHDDYTAVLLKQQQM